MSNVKSNQKTSMPAKPETPSGKYIEDVPAFAVSAIEAGGTTKGQIKHLVNEFGKKSRHQRRIW